MNYEKERRYNLKANYTASFVLLKAEEIYPRTAKPYSLSNNINH